MNTELNMQLAFTSGSLMGLIIRAHDDEGYTLAQVAEHTCLPEKIIRELTPDDWWKGESYGDA